MPAPSEKGTATSFRELSLDLNPSSITQRLARSTCCQRPLRIPPERCGSVRTTNPALVRIRLSPKPFKLTVNRGALSTRSLYRFRYRPESAASRAISCSPAVAARRYAPERRNPPQESLNFKRSIGGKATCRSTLRGSLSPNTGPVAGTDFQGGLNYWMPGKPLGFTMQTPGATSAISDRFLL